MARSASQIFERLGPAGLSRALAEVLDPGRLVHLATQVGLKYRGMRTKTQPRERLVSDLVAAAEKGEPARQAIVQALGKETSRAARDWAALDPEAKLQRLGAGSDVGLHLFLLASAEDDSDLDALGGRLARAWLLSRSTNGARAVPDAAASAPVRDEQRLRRRLTALEKKVRHGDAQLAKSRDVQRALKSDLIQRKGELAESRMLVERLRHELAGARTAAQVATAPKPAESGADPGLTELARVVRGLEALQRKLVHAVERARPAPAPRPTTADPRPALAEQSEQRIKRELERQRRELGQALEQQTRRIDELRAELVQRDDSVARRPGRRPRARGPGGRVGVFIDVQNVYYGARRLKGKLDFDALLQTAVRDRRLIQATAYLVESEEIDQSQFIARLEERAIRVRRKPLKVRADGSMKGDWDIELALDVLDAAPDLDVVVLVSGDGDFTSLAKRVKALGPRIEVIAFPRTTAKSLLEAADHFEPLDAKFMIHDRRRGSDGPRPAPERGADGDAAPVEAPPQVAAAAEDDGAPRRERARGQPR